MSHLRLVASTDPLVRCTKCGEEKPATKENFGANPGKKNGLSSWCRVCAGKNCRKWVREHRDESAIQRLEYVHNLKAQVFSKYGNRCNSPTCSTPGGCADVRCLQLDHVHNDGHKERGTARRREGTSKGRIYVLQRALKDTEGRYQLLCANCNMIKAWECNQARLLAAARRTALTGPEFVGGTAASTDPLIRREG